ncbi:uncharacterized protein EAF02_004218 [Botrytis sinoallii]|uniref:uncharacterized protein n=1 Tax=Botrytis sinoallii TaxID=1463999 RepID=UPI001900E5C1|nr:uncharacterized protein EAF02_004218 [Botrytis sinoallii]KAF7885709.1 hypothetical protein EAF02_004218 [Botrytis sinoallii]
MPSNEMDLRGWIAKWGQASRTSNIEHDIEQTLERDKRREQYIAYLLASKQIEAPQQLEASKRDDILQLRSLLPLHPNPAQHFERLSVVLMFRTPFSNLTRRQQNDYGWGLESVPLLEMFGREFLKKSCDLYAVDLGRLQLIVNELWLQNVFSPSLSLMSGLRKFTDTDLVSDWFRIAIGLPVLNKDRLVFANQSSPSGLLSTKERLYEPRTTPKQSSNAVAQKPKSSSNIAQPKVGGRTPRPTKSLYMTMISSTSKHGGKSNIYNPSALRRPKGATAPVQNCRAAQPTYGDSRSHLIPTSKDVSISRDNTPSRRFSTPDVSQYGDWESFCRSQSTKPKPRSRSFSEGPNSSRNSAPDAFFPAPVIHQYGPSESLPTPQPKQNSPDIWLGVGIVPASIQPQNSMLESPSTVTSDTGHDEDPMDIDDAVFLIVANTSLASSQVPTGSINSTPDYYDDGDAMDLDIPLPERQRRPSLTRHQTLLKSTHVASEAGSGAGATSRSNSRRSSICNPSPTASTVMNAMKINHSKVVRSSRRSRRSSLSPRDVVTKLEDLDTRSF